MDVSKLFERAQTALERNNLEYAVDLFQQILAIEPNFVVARKAIRGVQRRQLQQTGLPLPAKIMAVLKGMPVLVMILIFRITNNHERMMIECEKFLAGYPANLFILGCLADAARKAKYLDSAIACYEAIVEQNPEHTMALKELGRAYAAKGDVKKAQFYYDEVRRQNPDDMEADRAVRDLAALGTIKGGWDQAGSFREVMADEEKAQKLEEEQHVVRTSDDIEKAIANLQEELAKTPDQPRALVKLGDLLLRKDDFDGARDMYEKAQKIDAADATIRTKLGDAEIQRLAAEVKKLRAELAKKPDDAAVEQKFTAKRKERLRFTLEEYKRRVVEHPTDMGLRLENGKLLYSAGQIDAAISEFQKAVDSPKLKRASINLLGQCFMKKQLYDIAVAQFEKALTNLTVIDDDAKNLLYNLGGAHEHLGNLEKAEEYYKRIYETDIGFKDVSEKIERIYKKTAEKKGANADN